MADPLDVSGENVLPPDSGPEAPAPAPAAPPNLSESLELAFDESGAGETSSTDKPAVPEGERARDPLGRFAPKEGGAPGSAAPAGWR